jgi:hypothetical protein
MRRWEPGRCGNYWWATLRPAISHIRPSISDFSTLLESHLLLDFTHKSSREGGLIFSGLRKGKGEMRPFRNCKRTSTGKEPAILRGAKTPFVPA